MSAWSSLARHIGTANVMRAMNLYPPYLGAGIRVHASADGASVETSLRLTSLNQNFIGVHFGGSLYAMCDPFFVLLLAGGLGAEYLVLDKAASTRFVKMGRGVVRARFTLPEGEIARVRAAVARDRRTEPVYSVVVRDEAGDAVAEIDKTLYVRKQLRRVRR